jgi:hypothetical protein
MTPVKQLCGQCGYPYEADHLYCETCGHILPHALGGDPLDMTYHFDVPTALAEDLQWGTSYFHRRASLSFRLENDLVIPVSLRAKSVILGRGMELSIEHVDLNRYKGAELGVSRRHARIDQNREVLHITDLDSSNGTFLNRQRLVPGVPHILRNRAILQLAQLTLRVQFT